MGKPRPKKTNKKSASSRRIVGASKGVSRVKASSPSKGEAKDPAARPVKKRTAKRSTVDKDMGKERIQKVLSHYGVASRRAVE